MEKIATFTKNFNGQNQDPVSPALGDRIEYAPVDYWGKPSSRIPEEVRFGKDASDVWTHAYDATPVAKMEKASFGESRMEESPMKNRALEMGGRQVLDNQKIAGVYAKIKNFFGAQK